MAIQYLDGTGATRNAVGTHAGTGGDPDLSLETLNNSLATLAKSSTVATTSTAASATSVTLLASNANRLGATIFNDSSAILYLKLGATASSTSYAVQMSAGSYYEAPFRYSGVIDGIWASATGSARVTELS